MSLTKSSSCQHYKIIAWSVAVCITVLAFVGSYLNRSCDRGRPSFERDPHFDLPLPPTDLPYSRTNNIICMTFMTATGLFAVLLGARDARHTRAILPFVLPLSGAIIAFPETFIDIPIWFGYGVLMQMALQVLYNKASTRALWWFLALMMVSDLLVKEILLPMGVYAYYGNQPLVVLNMFPWWWMAPNLVGVFLATALAYRWRCFLTGFQSLAVLLLTPMSVGAIYGFIAFPGWVAVNGKYGWFLTDLLGLLTLVFGFVAFAGILELVLERSTFDLDGNGELNSLSQPSADADAYADEP